MSLDLTSLEDAVAQLSDALDMYGSDLVGNHPELRKHLRASAIQAFEFTYELSFKMIKRYLKTTMANPAAIGDMEFDQVIREAYGMNLLLSDVSSWRGHRAHRGATSHTYDESKAQEVFEGASGFLDEARYLLNQLQARNRPLD